jgi:hypothetical protein
MRSWLANVKVLLRGRGGSMNAEPEAVERLLWTRVESVGLIDPADPYAEPVPRADSCPKAIIDTDPEGHGLGVWLLVGKPEPGICAYKYAGGIV